VVEVRGTASGQRVGRKRGRKSTLGGKKEEQEKLKMRKGRIIRGRKNF
jgi:hypothetical protein